MAARKKVDHELVLIEVPVTFKNGSKAKARAEGNNAAWMCACGAALPLIGRCYFQFGDTCRTKCPDCDRVYRVAGDAKKRARSVAEV